MLKQTQKEVGGGIYELTPEATESLKDSKYYNDDLAPSTKKDRTWKTGNYLNLWIGMVICISCISISSTMVALGMSPLMAWLSVVIGNVIVIFPIMLNAKIGAKYGVTFPVFSRLVFGKKGSHIPTLSRSIVACGWTSVNCWIGGGAVAAILGCFAPKLSDMTNTVKMPGNPATPVGQIVGFFIFIAIAFLVAYNGLDKVKVVQDIGSPILIAVMIALFVYSVVMLRQTGHTIGDVFRVQNDAKLMGANGGFLFIFCAGLTSNISFWGTMALNIPDFARTSVDQKAQRNGMLMGLPIPMAICAFVGIIFAQATKYATGTASWDPTSVLYMIVNKIVVIIAAAGVLIGTLTTVVAANMVSPANGFANINPKKITYKHGVIITVIIAIVVFQPWWVYGSAAGFVFGFLNNYGTIIAPIAALFIADYYLVKKGRVDIYGLYDESNKYTYKKGWNLAAYVSWICAFILPLTGNTVLSYQNGSGLVPNAIQYIAANGYIFSFVVAFVLYLLLMKTPLAGDRANNGALAEEELGAITAKANMVA